MKALTDMKLTHTVIKNEDVLDLPKGEEWMKLINNITDVINVNRMPRLPNTYIVINTDEPYADEIIEILKRHGHWG